MLAIRVQPVVNFSRWLIAGLLSALATAAFAGGGAPSYQDREAGALLREIGRAQATGDFESAWRGWMRYLEHPGRNEPYLDDFSACFFYHECPRPGWLGAMLGKTKQEAGALTTFCPRWRRLLQSLDNDPDRAADLDLIRTSALWKDTCPEWHEQQLAMLHEQAVPQPELAPQALPLQFQWVSNERVFPNVRMSFGEHSPFVLVDTGSTTSSAEGTDSRLAGYLSSGAPLTSVWTRTHQGVRAESSFRAPSLRLGAVKLDEVMVNVGPDRLAPEVEHIIGMNILLRFKAVCFDWARAKLHLGAADPCDSGVELDRARLLGIQVFALEHTMKDGSTLDIALDTGTTKTTCSDIFLDRNDGEQAFSIGTHPDLRIACRKAEPLLPGETPLAAQPGQHQARIGMETFLRFDAFGWELNPLRVYFVPKADEPKDAS